MVERWATFDCYGTLVDWNGGIGDQLARLFGDESRDRLLARYHELEPEIEAGHPGMRYRNVMALTLGRIADEENVVLAPGEEDAFGRSLPDWRVFPEVPAALEQARANGFRLGILSNSDPELIQASISRIGVHFDDAITASEIGSYKPALGHWRAFADRHGRLPDVHVGASLFHDVGPANELEIPAVWVNRLAEQAADRRPSREIGDLAALPGVLDELVPS